MNVLVTGATGVIGRQAIPRLLQAGHEVTGVARSAAGARWLRAVGAKPVEVDLFDPAMVAAAVTDADAVVHLATAIPPLARMRRPGAWHTNDRLRTHATRNLVDAAIAAGAEVFVQESVSFVYADGGAAWLGESAAVDPPVAATRSALVAEAETDRFATAGGRGVALRMARLYGPGRASAELADLALARAGVRGRPRQQLRLLPARRGRRDGGGRGPGRAERDLQRRRRRAGHGTAVDRVAGCRTRRPAASPASRLGRAEVAWQRGRPARGLPAGLQPSLPPGGGLGTSLSERGGRMADGWHRASAICMSRQVATLALLPALAWLRHPSHGTRPEELGQWR